MSDDRDDVLSLAGWIYSARVTGEAGLKADTGLAGRCVAEAKELVAEVSRQTHTPDQLGHLPADAADYLRCLCKWGPLPVSGAKGADARRVLLKAGLGSWQGDDLFAATDRGRAVCGEQEVLQLGAQEDAE